LVVHLLGAGLVWCKPLYSQGFIRFLIFYVWIRE
jgi:hypothetical protein